ncbi:MAG: alpha-2-macroglobulin, partial [Rhodanobacteraceae bacterium]
MRLVRLLSVLATCLMLAACGKPSETGNALPAVQGSTPAPAPAATASKPGRPLALTLEAAGSKMHVGRLNLVLTFNQRLAGAQNFDKLLRLNDSKGAQVDGGWALDEDGLSLRFTPIKANVSYQVHVDADLTAADGASLGEAIDKDVYTGPMQPSVGFASRGSVLPARETRGLPVIAVNTSQVDVEFYRVHDKSLNAFFAAYTHNGLRNSWDLDPRWGWGSRKGAPVTRIADSVYSHRFTLDCNANERCINYLPIQDISQLDRPGAYFAVMRRAGDLEDSYATNVFYVSNIGLHTRAYKNRLFVHAASLATGEPLPGVQLKILGGGGNDVTRAQTDEHGNALLAYSLDADDVLIGTLDGDVSMLPFNQPALDLSAFKVAGPEQADFDVFSWSDRDLYRPGETLSLSALLRDFDGHMMDPQPLFVTLRQPDGRAFVSSRLKPAELGYYSFSQAIPEDATTGTWQVEFRLDPASKQTVESMKFHVEDFLPERLKLDLDSKNPSIRGSLPLHLEVQSDYLYGAPASGNRFTAKLTLAVDQHPIKELEDYWFGDPTIDVPKKARDVLDTKLDEKGQLQKDVDPFQGKPPATPVAAFLSGSVYETGGRTVTRTIKRTVWPADVLVGVHPMFDPNDGANSDSRAGFELIRANSKGELLAGKNLKVKLIRAYRRYHWNWTDDGGWGYDWSSYYDEVGTRTVNIPAGQSLKLDFPVEYGNYRLEVTDPDTGLTMRYPFYAGWSWDDDNRGNEARPDKVKLALDKTAYHKGDTLKVTVTAPKAGPGVLLVESDHLLYTRNIDAQPGATFEIPVTAEWMRHDVYVTALVFRGGSARQQSTPARAVGEVHVPIDRSQRKLALALKAPDKMRPGQDLKVSVDAPQLAGKTGQVTVSAVDVGVLNITRFKLPDPFTWFFQQRALGVDAYDLYGRIIEAFKGGTARLAYGGDMALAALPQSRRPTAEHKTVDLFSGPVRFDAQGHAQASMPMPEFNGTVRISAVAFGKDSFGSAQTETIVRAPLVLEASTPKVMAPGDQSMLTVDVTNFTGSEAEIKLTAKSDEGLAIGHASHTLKLADGAKTTVSMPLTARAQFGSAHIDINATAGETEVHTGRNMIVRAAWPEVARSHTTVLTRLAPVQFTRKLTSGLIAQSMTARMTLTTLPPLPFALSLDRLLSYPYRCLEQTTSTGYGALLMTPKLAEALHMSPLGEGQRRQRVENELGRLASLQLPNGHFSMWGGGHGEAATFLTPYAVDFMLDARDAGFAVNNQVLQNALERLKDDLL